MFSTEAEKVKRQAGRGRAQETDFNKSWVNLGPESLDTSQGCYQIRVECPDEQRCTLKVTRRFCSSFSLTAKSTFLRCLVSCPLYCTLDALIRRGPQWAELSGEIWR